MCLKVESCGYFVTPYVAYKARIGEHLGCFSPDRFTYPTDQRPNCPANYYEHPRGRWLTAVANYYCAGLAGTASHIPPDWTPGFHAFLKPSDAHTWMSLLGLDAYGYDTKVETVLVRGVVAIGHTYEGLRGIKASQIYFSPTEWLVETDQKETDQ